MKTQTTLGLDIGTNSIGWALIQENNSIIDLGVRIFPIGVQEDDLKANHNIDFMSIHHTFTVLNLVKETFESKSQLVIRIVLRWEDCFKSCQRNI